MPGFTVPKAKLWPHQRKALKLCSAYFAAASPRSALVHLPTGTGKTGIIATIAAERSAAAPVLVVCPSAALVAQISDEIRSGFWAKIGAPATCAPDQVVQLLPNTAEKLAGALGAGADRTVIVGTIQALQQVYASKTYAQFVGKIGTVLFDEGHREPAPQWARAARGFDAPTVLFSATPYRNDLKLFEVDDNHISFLSFKEAVGSRLIRGIEISEENLPGDVRAFARTIIARRDGLVASGRFRAEDKLIVRANSEIEVDALVDAFVAELAHRRDGVIGIHHNFPLDDVPGRARRPDVPANLRARTERFLIHQHMLTEGIDDPACTMLALYAPFSNERQLVQQVGRLTRHPTAAGAAAANALVLSRVGDRVSEMWNRFLDYDDACVQNGGRPPIRNDQSVLAGLLAAMPTVDYVGGKFRQRVDLEDGKLLEGDLRVPRAANIFDLEPTFDIDAFGEGVGAALAEDDRSEVHTGQIGDASCRFHLSLRMNHSPLFAKSLFQSAALEVTVYARHDDKLFFYDSAGLWIDEAPGVAARLSARTLRKLLPQRGDTVVTSLSIKNADLGPYSLRTRSMSARSLSLAGVFMGEHTHVVARAGGRVADSRRTLSFATARISEREGERVTLSDHLAWTQSLAKELERPRPAVSLFKRFASPIDVPKRTAPANILLDLEGMEGEFVDATDQTVSFDPEAACAEIRHDGNAPAGYDLVFDFPIGGASKPVWIRWDRTKGKYWLKSPALSSLKLKGNDRLTLTHRLNRQQPFRIIPEGSANLYAYGKFYTTDLDLTDEAPAKLIIDLIEPLPQLRALTSEKGELVAAATSWPADSLFGFIDRSLNGRRGPLGAPFPAFVCDDLGTEVGDFLGVDDVTPRAAIIVAKHKTGAPGVSAAALYDACSQGVKNLAYLKFGSDRLPGRETKWDDEWKLNGGRVPRLRSGPDSRGFRKLFASVCANPRSSREVWLILGGGVLSKRAFERELQRDHPAAHVLQAYHLLLSAYSSCLSVGVALRIFAAD